MKKITVWAIALVTFVFALKMQAQTQVSLFFTDCLGDSVKVTYYDYSIKLFDPFDKYTYQWYQNSTLLAGEISDSLDASSLGSNFYHVEITDSTGCTTLSPNAWLNCVITRIEEDEFSFRFSLPDNKEHVIEIWNVLGAKVTVFTTHKNISLEKGNMESGIYFITIDGKFKKKFFI